MQELLRQLDAIEQMHVGAVLMVTWPDGSSAKLTKVGGYGACTELHVERRGQRENRTTGLIRIELLLGATLVSVQEVG